MREIKFELIENGKIIGYETYTPHYNGGVWYYVLYSEGENAVRYCEIYWPKSMNQLQRRQYTGLKDKNGKEIYEGDIVTDEQNFKDKLIVFWDIGLCSFELRQSNDPEYGYQTHFHTMTSCHIRWHENSSLIDHSNYDCPDYNPYEIIGNIYENPELLEAQNE